MKHYAILLCSLVVLLAGCQTNGNSGTMAMIDDGSKDSRMSLQNNFEEYRKAREKVVLEKISGGAKQEQISEMLHKEVAHRDGIQFFIGDWAIWIPGSFAERKSTSDGTVEVTREYVLGVQGKVLSIYADGTYRWETPTEVITGRWIDNEDGRIVLLSGQWDFDWYVEKTGDNELKYYSYGVEEYGTRIEY